VTGTRDARAGVIALVLSFALLRCSSDTPVAPPSGAYLLSSVGGVSIPGLVVDTLPDPYQSGVDSVISGSITFVGTDSIAFVTTIRSRSSAGVWASNRSTDTSYVTYTVDDAGTMQLNQPFRGSAGQDTVLATPVDASGTSLTFSVPYGICVSRGSPSDLECIMRFKKLVYAQPL
jgi:hypothetical protein